MSTASNWREVKAKARALDPTWDKAERVQRRTRMREELLASVSGAQLAVRRKQLGLTRFGLTAQPPEPLQARTPPQAPG